VIRSAKLATLVAVSAAIAACNKDIKPQLPTLVVMMETPPPPARLVIPVELPEPPPPAPDTPEPPAPTPTPPRTAPTTAPRPTERPAAAAPSETAPPPVLRTTTDTSGAERRITQLIASAEENLNKVNFRDLNPNARTQYDSARNFIRQAGDYLKVKNYSYAEQLATRAATLAALLIKG
jgi:hypothetical protein